MSSHPRRSRLPRIMRRKGARRADRLTVGLATVAVGTAGTVIATEIARLARRRIRPTAAPAIQHEGTELPLDSNGRGTQDAVVVLVVVFDDTATTEKVLFNMLTGFVSAF